VKAPKTSGGGRTPVRHTIPLGIVIFLVLIVFWSRFILDPSSETKETHFIFLLVLINATNIA